MEKTERQLVDIFVKAAVSHGDATLNGDYRKCNEAYSVIEGVFVELKNRGRAKDVLADSLTDNELSVRLWASSYLLQYLPEESAKVLRDISNNYSGILRLNAEMVLEQWEKGELQF
jgi:Domain of unknown function (DUF2019)